MPSSCTKHLDVNKKELEGKLEHAMHYKATKGLLFTGIQKSPTGRPWPILSQFALDYGSWKLFFIVFFF